MKRSTKHVALDVHQATTVASMREESGRVIARSVLPTDGPALTRWALRSTCERSGPRTTLLSLVAGRLRRHSPHPVCAKRRLRSPGE